MKVVLYCLIACGFAVLLGCETMQVNSDKPLNTSAPKLQIASELFNSRDEPAKAEELIREEIERYRDDKNQLGLAEAYRQYGLLLRSNAVEKFESYYREKGFEDKSIKYDQRYEKAIEYFDKAKEIFEDYGRIDTASNLYISLAKTYDLMNRRKEACTSFAMGLEKYQAYKKLNPEALELRSEEMQRYEEYIGILMQQAGCTASAASAVSSETQQHDGSSSGDGGGMAATTAGGAR